MSSALTQPLGVAWRRMAPCRWPGSADLRSRPASAPSVPGGPSLGPLFERSFGLSASPVLAGLRAEVDGERDARHQANQHRGACWTGEVGRCHEGLCCLQAGERDCRLGAWWTKFKTALPSPAPPAAPGSGQVDGGGRGRRFPRPAGSWWRDESGWLQPGGSRGWSRALPLRWSRHGMRDRRLAIPTAVHGTGLGQPRD
jgi:hypothetical protein